MNLIDVVSTNVQSVGYDPRSRVMRVVFKSGGIYDYADVRQTLFEQMCLPHPWRRVGREVKNHPYQKVG